MKYLLDLERFLVITDKRCFFSHSVYFNWTRKTKIAVENWGKTRKLIFAVDYFGNVDITANAKLFVESTSQ